MSSSSEKLNVKSDESSLAEIMELGNGRRVGRSIEIEGGKVALGRMKVAFGSVEEPVGGGDRVPSGLFVTIVRYDVTWVIVVPVTMVSTSVGASVTGMVRPGKTASSVGRRTNVSTTMGCNNILA